MPAVVSFRWTSGVLDNDYQTHINKYQNFDYDSLLTNVMFVYQAILQSEEYEGWFPRVFFQKLSIQYWKLVTDHLGVMKAKGICYWDDFNAQNI